MPHKLAYAGVAALTHNRLVNESDYQAVVGEGAAEAGFLAQSMASSKISLTQFCDIGPGNGYHTSEFLKSLGTRKIIANRYLGLDFSEFLLAICEARLASCLPGVETSVHAWNIEAGATPAITDWRNSPGPVVVTILGHTIGNLDSPSRALNNVRRSCLPGDLIVISVAMRGDQDSAFILKQYSNESFRRAAVEPLRMAGLDITKGSLEMSISESESCVTGKFVFSKPCSLAYDGELINFHAADSIDCFISRRFTPASLDRIMRESELHVIAATTDVSGNHGIWLASVP